MPSEKTPSITDLAKRTVDEFMADQPFQMAAALSYYTLLSLAPLLLVVVGVAGLIFGQSASSGQLVGQLESSVGPQTAQAIQDLLAHANANGPGQGLLSTIVGIIMVLIGASTIFVQLQIALNRIWKVDGQENQHGFVWHFLRQRLFSLAIILGLGFLLIVSLLLSAFISAVHGYLTNLFPGAATLIRILNILISLGIITVLFALIFYFLPDAHVAWRAVWPGAFLTSVLFTIGKYFIGLYLGRTGISSTYGAAGSIVVLMVWVYYASIIFFLGAEITKVYALRFTNPAG